MSSIAADSGADVKPIRICGRIVDVLARHDVRRDDDSLAGFSRQTPGPTASIVPTAFVPMVNGPGGGL